MTISAAKTVDGKFPNVKITHHLIDWISHLQHSLVPQSTTVSRVVIIQKPISGVMEKCFGVIADIQHADVEDGCDFR